MAFYSCPRVMNIETDQPRKSFEMRRLDCLAAICKNDISVSFRFQPLNLRICDPPVGGANLPPLSATGSVIGSPRRTLR
jgi:hypothetical protein